jgi:hypothetical protein
MLLGIILGLVGWINQAFIAGEWTWHTSVRPFLAANVWPYAPGTQASSGNGRYFTLL